MRVIVEPKGRALEYSLLSLNLYGRSSCSHRCRYCYCPSALQMPRQVWEHMPFKPRKDILKLVRKDAAELAGTNKRVLLMFLGDPYSPEAKASGVTREALKILREYDVPFQILTKGGTRAVDDFDLYGPNDAFATTLVFVSEQYRQEWEPGAAPFADRLKAIGEAHKRGIETWVSLEPVIDVNETLSIIDCTHEWVDLYKLGKVNHDAKLEAKIDWRALGVAALERFTKYRKRYYLKNDLVKYLEGLPFENTDTRTVDRPVVKPQPQGLFGRDAC